MSWSTASTELNDNQTRIKDSDVSGPLIRGGQTSINWSQFGIKII